MLSALYLPITTGTVLGRFCCADLFHPGSTGSGLTAQTFFVPKLLAVGIMFNVSARSHELKTVPV